ncbi:hypothetical protein [Escherichia coli]|uniref:hypothetical protein n=1 Tax=Escherichia coli TaxID=562 RepID=UPI0019665C7E|nr:hypothetical protein [Escherichia coli]
MLDILNLIVNNGEVILGALGSIIAVASIFTAHTATPDPSTKLGKAYKVVELLALNYGKAKQIGKVGGFDGKAE